jgi:hypothetical protein
LMLLARDVIGNGAVVVNGAVLDSRTHRALEMR